MGHWGVKSYECDDAADAIDRALDRVHGAVYEELMDDGNPLTFDQVQAKLLNVETLAIAVAILESPDELEDAVADEGEGPESEPERDELRRLAFAGIVVRHAEFGVAIPDEWRDRGISALEAEEIEWEQATARKLRRAREIELLRRADPG